MSYAQIVMPDIWPALNRPQIIDLSSDQILKIKKNMKFPVEQLQSLLKKNF